jgi:hypothetical protein
MSHESPQHAQQHETICLAMPDCATDCAKAAAATANVSPHIRMHRLKVFIFVSPIRNDCLASAEQTDALD